MIEDEDISGMVADFDQWVQTNSRRWKQYRYAYENRFWESGATMGSDGTAHQQILDGYPIKVQINHVRTWVFSFVDALFHKGLRTVVGRPTLVKGDAKSVLGLSDDSDEESDQPKVSPTDRLAAMNDYWLRQEDIESVTERGFIMGMLYPEIAFKVGTHNDPTMHPLENIWLDILPPWECMWDRRARSVRQMRFVAHPYWISIEEFKVKFPDVDTSDIKGSIPPDTIEDNLGQPSKPVGELRDDNYIRILEFYDLTADHEVPTEGDESVAAKGEFRVYVLQGLKTQGNEPVHVGPVGWTYINGRPLPNIIPTVLLNVPEFPLKGISPVDSIYELNSEINYANTFLINAARYDAARKLLVNRDVVDDEVMASLTDGKDMGIVPVETERLDLAMKFLDSKPVSGTILEVLRTLEQARESTSNLSPLSRGQAIKYATAAEVQSLDNYSETTLGRIRKRMDGTVKKVIKLMYRVLSGTMHDADITEFSLLVDGQVVTILREWLDEPWDIELSDAAATPQSEAAKRIDFQQAAPLLMDLHEKAKMGDEMAKAMLEYVIDIFDLPADFRNVMQEMQVQPPPPVAPELPPPSPGSAEAGVAPPGGPALDSIAAAVGAGTGVV